MYMRTRTEHFATSQAPHHARHYSLERLYDAYYGRAQRVRTKIADELRTAFERFDFVVTPTSPSVAFELGAKTSDRCRCTSTTTARCDVARRDPGDLDPCGQRGPAGRLPARRPGVRREQDARRGVPLETAIGFDATRPLRKEHA